VAKLRFAGAISFGLLAALLYARTAAASGGIGGPAPVISLKATATASVTARASLGLTSAKAGASTTTSFPADVTVGASVQARPDAAPAQAGSQAGIDVGATVQVHADRVPAESTSPAPTGRPGGSARPAGGGSGPPSQGGASPPGGSAPSGGGPGGSPSQGGTSPPRRPAVTRDSRSATTGALHSTERRIPSVDSGWFARRSTGATKPSPSANPMRPVHAGSSCHFGFCSADRFEAGGAGSGGGTGFFPFALLIGSILLAAPRAGRRLRPAAELARPPVVHSPLERPG
jgi:hypothetical protein